MEQGSRRKGQREDPGSGVMMWPGICRLSDGSRQTHLILTRVLSGCSMGPGQMELGADSEAYGAPRRGLLPDRLVAQAALSTSHHCPGWLPTRVRAPIPGARQGLKHARTVVVLRVL